MIHIMGLDMYRGKSEKQYLISNGFNQLTEEVKPENIVFLQGCVANGKSVLLGKVESKSRETVSCSSCGARTICSKQVEGNETCSYCIAGSDDQKIRDQQELSCDQCTFLGCSWHDANMDTPPFEMLG